jgi:glycosyltransferase involved in cell wall biosynthesis
MQITFVLPPADLSGGMRVVSIYAERLSHMGHKVSIISPPSKLKSLREKVRSWRNGSGWPEETTHSPSHLDAIGLDHRVLERWRSVGDGDVPDGDVVIATWWETAEWVKALSPTKGAKVYFIQAHEVFPYLPIARCRATYHFPMHKIVVSRWLKRVMELEYGDPIVDLVPNSIDKSQFHANDRGKQAVATIGFLYATTPIKGLDITLEAVASVRKRTQRLQIISFGSETPIPELALPEGADFFYSPPQDKIRDLYGSCDVWVTASRSEGFNLPAMEAMACRTPVVATRTGWPEEAVKPRWNGILANVEDTKGIADGIEWVLSQRDEAWRKLSCNAYATVADTSWDASAALFEKALKHACTRANRGEIKGNASASVEF